MLKIMLSLDNRTRYRAELVTCWNAEGAEVALIVAKATYDVDAWGKVTLAENQAPIRFSDDYYGRPNDSSVRYASDLALYKPSADVVINGTARSPMGRKVEQLLITVRIGSALKQLLVTGDRHWDGLTTTRPLPFSEMPVIYERAIHDKCNPVGVGWWLDRSNSTRSQLPNIELFGQQISTRTDRPASGGLGAIAPHWWSRARYAGTYDSAWQQDRLPFLPKDFDHRFFQSAAEGMRIPTPRGGEVVELTNLTSNGKLRFILHVPSITLLLRYDRKLGDATLTPDTVLIEPDAARFEITLRSQIPCEGKSFKLREVIVTEAGGDTIRRAFLQGKRILSHRRVSS
jgi:hypothetical protein